MPIAPNQNQSHPDSTESSHTVSNDGFKRIFLAADTVAALRDKSNFMEIDPIKDRVARDVMKNILSFGSGKASGKNRAEKAPELAMSVLFTKDDDYVKVKIVTIYIFGSPNMTMNEYDVIVKKILVKLPENALASIVVFSVGTWQDCIQVTIELNGVIDHTE